MSSLEKCIPLTNCQIFGSFILVILKGVIWLASSTTFYQLRTPRNEAELQILTTMYVDIESYIIVHVSNTFLSQQITVNRTIYIVIGMFFQRPLNFSLTISSLHLPVPFTSTRNLLPRPCIRLVFRRLEQVQVAY